MLGGADYKYDFSRPVTLRIANKKESKSYRIYLHSFTGLPVMWIETDGRQDITSKDDYLHARFKLVEDVETRGAGDIISESIYCYLLCRLCGNTVSGGKISEKGFNNREKV